MRFSGGVGQSARDSSNTHIGRSINSGLYWEPQGGLLDRPRTEYKPHVLDGNPWLVLQRTARPSLSPPLLIRALGDLNQMNSGVYGIPAWLRADDLIMDGSGRTQYLPNLSLPAQHYLERLGVDAEDLFYHALGILHDPKYHEANGDALRMDRPRIPLPGWPEGLADGAARELTASAARGRQLAALLDSDTPVVGVTTGVLRSEISAIAVPTTVAGGNMADDDFAVSAGWGHFGTGEAIMPGHGRAVEREYMWDERAVLADAVATLGETTFDVYLNDHAYWRNVPAAVWNYQLGGFQVLKKWLSYRENKVLGRGLRPEEVQHFTDTARRIGAVLQMAPKGSRGTGHPERVAQRQLE